MSTVAVSALISIVTGFLGALLSTGWVRRQERRTYGLALLAELKSIRRSLFRYRRRISQDEGTPIRHDAGALRLWHHDLSVFANNSGRIGLFSARTAIQLIEFYHQIRWLEARVAEIDAAEVEAAELDRWLRRQHEVIHQTQAQSRHLSRRLRHEVQPTLANAVGALIRRSLRSRHGTRERGG